MIGQKILEKDLGILKEQNIFSILLIYLNTNNKILKKSQKSRLLFFLLMRFKENLNFLKPFVEEDAAIR